MIHTFCRAVLGQTEYRADRLPARELIAPEEGKRTRETSGTYQLNLID